MTKRQVISDSYVQDMTSLKNKPSGRKCRE